MLKLISKVKIAKDGGEVYKDFPVDRLEFKNKQSANQNDDVDEEIDDDVKKILD